MKKIYTIILSVSMAFMAISCDITDVFSGEWLDINTNPNYVSEADMKMLLPSAHLNLVTKVGYDLTLYGSFWSQYVVQCSTTNQYYTIMTNDVTNETFQAPWSYLYTRVLPSLHEVIEKAEKADNASNYLVEAKTTLVYALYLLTSLYDQVAYTEGYVTPSQTPKFDSGKDMQATLISLLEEIRSMDAAQAAADEVLNTTVSSDMFFKGDTTPISPRLSLSLQRMISWRAMRLLTTSRMPPPSPPRCMRVTAVSSTRPTTSAAAAMSSMCLTQVILVCIITMTIIRAALSPVPSMAWPVILPRPAVWLCLRQTPSTSERSMRLCSFRPRLMPV